MLAAGGPRVRILMVDDHTLFREALIAAVLDPEFESPSVISAGSLEDAERVMALEGGFDLVLLDLELGSGVEPGVGESRDLPSPDRSGLEILGLSAERFPATPVVVVSGSDSGHDVREAWRRGARAYLPKTVSAHEMRHALRTVLGGARYLPPGLVGYVEASGTSGPGSAGTDHAYEVTGRQREVLGLMARGWSNKEIARELDLTEGTVKIHVHDVLQRLECRNRTEAAVQARRLGLIPGS